MEGVSGEGLLYPTPSLEPEVRDERILGAGWRDIRDTALAPPPQPGKAWQGQTMCVDLRSDQGSTTCSDPGSAVPQPSFRLGKEEKGHSFILLRASFSIGKQDKGHSFILLGASFRPGKQDKGHSFILLGASFILRSGLGNRTKAIPLYFSGHRSSSVQAWGNRTKAIPLYFSGHPSGLGNRTKAIPLYFSGHRSSERH